MPRSYCTRTLALFLSSFSLMLSAQVSTPLGSTSPIQTATVSFAAAGTTGHKVSVLTLGAENLDFRYVDGGSCKPNTRYEKGDTCTVNYTFTPAVASDRLGAIQVNAANGGILGTNYIFGTTTGPQAGFLPPTLPISNVGGGITSLRDQAVDGNGTVYVADFGTGNLGDTGKIVKIPSGCASASCTSNLAVVPYSFRTYYNRSTGIAVDGAGNVYYNGDAGVVMMPPSCTTASCVTSVGGGISTGELYIAVDGSGNAWVSDTQNSVIKKVPAGCTTASCAITMGGGFSVQQQIAVSLTGTVYINDVGHYLVKQMPNTCTSASCVTTTLSAWEYGLDVDVSGTLWMGAYNSSYATSDLYRVPASCTQFFGCATKLISSATGTLRLKVDGAANVFYATNGGTSLQRLGIADQPTLTFPSTVVNNVSAAQNVTLLNTGNAVMNISALPVVNANLGGSANTCAVGTSLAAGASCVLGIQFVPTTVGASVSGSVKVTFGSTTKTITVNGPSVAATATIGTMTVTPATLVAGTSQAVTISDNVAYTGAKPTGAVKFTLNSVAYTAACTGTASPLTCSATVPAATIAALPIATYSVTSALAADSAYAATTGDTGTLTVQPAASLGTPVLSPTSVSYGTSQVLTLTVSEPYGGAKPTGAVSFSLNNANYAATCTGSATPLSCTATVPASVVSTLDVNSYPVVATSAADANYPVLTSASSTFTVNMTTPTVSAISFSPATWVYGSAPALTLTNDITFSGAPPTPLDALFYMGYSNSYTDATCTTTGAHTARCTVTYPSSYTSTLPVGNSFYVQFNVLGMGNYQGAYTYDQSTLVITQGSKTITFPQPANGTINGTATLTATVNGTDGVTYTIVSGNAVMTGSNTIKYTGGGAVVIAADSAASNNYAAAAEVTRTVTVAPGNTTLVQTAPTAVNYGVSTTLKATLTFPGAALPTGAVTFTVGGTQIVATCTGSASPFTCTASSPAGTNAGSTSVTAAYAGDTAYNASTAASTTYTINKVTATGGLLSSQTPTYGDPTVTLTFNGSFPSAGVMPSSVQFRDPSNNPFTGTATCTTVSAGKFTCTQTVPATVYTSGTQYSVYALINADTNYIAGTVYSGSLTISKQTPVITATATDETYGYSTANVTVNVAFAGTRTGPTGAIAVSVNGQSYQNATCSGAASPIVCTIAYPITATASSSYYPIAVSYAGDANFASATGSGRVNLVNQKATFSVPTVTIAQGTGSITLTAIESWVGTTVPLNLVYITTDAGGGRAATCTTVSATSRSCSIPFDSTALAIGSHTIMASQSSTTPFDASSGTGMLNVTGSSTLSLGATQPSSGGVQLTALIGNVPSSYNGGSVTFYDASTIVCSAVALTNASAICVTPTLSNGTHSFTAVYSGDSLYTGSNSNSSPIVITVDPATNTGGGSTAPGAQAAPVPVTLVFGANFTLGSINLSNSGSASAFTISGGSCTVGASYTAGQSCTVNVVFTNPGSGLLIGTLSLTDNKTPQNAVGTATVSALGSR